MLSGQTHFTQRMLLFIIIQTELALFFWNSADPKTSPSWNLWIADLTPKLHSLMNFTFPLMKCFDLFQYSLTKKWIHRNLINNSQRNVETESHNGVIFNVEDEPPVMNFQEYVLTSFSHSSEFYFFRTILPWMKFLLFLFNKHSLQLLKMLGFVSVTVMNFQVERC